MPILKLAEMSYPEVDQLDRRRTAAFVTVSPIEEHGPHLPLGVDLLDSEYFLDRIAERLVAEREDWTVLRLPAIPLGTWVFDAPGSIGVRASAVRDVVFDLGESLARHDIRYVIVSSGHGAVGHLVALEEACAAIERRYGIKMVSMSSQIIPEVLSGAFNERIAECLKRPMTAEERRMLKTDAHAGILETSMMLKLAPEQVGEHRHLAPYDPPPVERLIPQYAMRWGGLGYVGYPAEASAELGEAALAAMVDSAYEKLLECLESPYYEPRRLTAKLPFLRTDVQRVGLWGAALFGAAALGWWLGRRR